MKCVITGHSSGIGFALKELFERDDWEVLGMSRSNGYNISENQDRIINDALGCDLFINNASSDSAQFELLTKLCQKIPKIITLGSGGSDFTDIWDKQYTIDKKELEEKSRLLSLIDKPNMADMLFVKMAFAETTYSRLKENRIDSDYTVSYQELYEIIQFWLLHPMVRQIEFQFKLTNYTISQIKKLVKYPEKVDIMLDNINSLVNYL
jgi:hypothetical protein